MSEPSEFVCILTEEISPFVALSEAQAARLEQHWQLLVRWNKSLNLTTVTKLPEAAVRHYGESLFLAAHLPAGMFSAVDVGSGPGFPGIPVAVARPECTVTLVESHQRKAVFLREATRDLGNVKVAAVRAEMVDGAAFEWVISRAVRWQDVIRVSGANLALLLGEEDASSLMKKDEWSWESPVPLPWGKHRVLILGHRV